MCNFDQHGRILETADARLKEEIRVNPNAFSWPATAFHEGGS
jgi:hypothetical protein